MGVDMVDRRICQQAAEDGVRLTGTQRAESVLGRLARSARACPPFRERVRAIEVIAESGTDRWHRRWRIPLGPAAQARSTSPPGSPRTVRR